jgi:pSer/pThr/pTyr-binding forkhead associated (FHA) protein
MRDGRTREIAGPERVCGLKSFLSRYSARVVVVSGGDDAGVEFPIRKERVILGRGPGVDLAFKDSAMSRQHAALEYTSDGFRIQDLGSTNGVLVNRKPAQTAELRNGDHMQIGNRIFQLVIEEQESAPEIFELSPGA